jgi:hypothetical protein
MGISLLSLFKSFLPPGLGLVDKGDLAALVNATASGASGIVALVGGTAASSPVLTAAINQVDTSTGSNTDSVALPPAHTGQEVAVINNTANTIKIWANPNNLDNGGVADAIIDSGTTGAGSASITIATNKVYLFFSGKAGIWKAGALA